MRPVLLYCFLMISISGFTKAFPLSENSRIYVITAGGDSDELYAAFGHSAIRVVDSIRNFDVVYNYGSFDFEQPNFYLNFTMGRPYYFLASGSYDRFQYVYIYFNRDLKAQELNLTLEERQTLFDFLQWNDLPANKFYVYDYFYDNCTTRIRDALKTIFPDRVTFDSSYIKQHLTIRHQVDLYTVEQPWGNLGIDICLGLPMDKILNSSEYMFLPENLFTALEKATIKSGDSTKPLVAKTYNIYNSVPEDSGMHIGPKVVFWVILLVVAAFTFWEIIKRRHLIVIDTILFGSVWLLSIFLLFLWFFTNHKASWNFNLLWANPFHIIFLYLLFKEKRKKLIIIHFLGYGILQLLVLIFWNILPQEINPSLVPLVIVLALRSLWIYRFITSQRNWASE